MGTVREKKSWRNVIMPVLFWLFIQAGILNNALSFAIALDQYSYRYYGIWSSMTMYVFDICFTFTVIAYTIIGVVINNRFPINSRKWWKTIGICYATYLVLTFLGGALIGGRWFWDGTGNYLMAVVWIAPVLWLGEMEVVHWYLSNQQRQCLSIAENDRL